MTTRSYYQSNHSSPAAVHEVSFAQKWKKTTTKRILGRSQAHAGKSPHNLFLCDLITVIVGWVSGGHSRGELLSIRIHRRNPKMNEWTFSTRQRQRDEAQKEENKPETWANAGGGRTDSTQYKDITRTQGLSWCLGFWTPALFCWCGFNMTFYTFVY